MTKTVVYPPDASENRLDIFLFKLLSEFSRTFIQKKIKEGQIQVEGRTVKPGYRLSTGEVITIRILPPEESQLVPVPLPLTIVFEDAHLIVVDKPAGLVTHPAASYKEPTLVHALLHHCPDLPGVGGVKRPGIVHRLDKDTSGLIVVAKDDQTYQGLKGQWEKRTVKREYLTICQGPWQDPKLEVEAPIGRHPVHRKKMTVTAKNSRAAVTTFTLIEDLGEYALLKAELATGRTHQIRVHLTYLKHPIIGDQLYGNAKVKRMLSRQALHSHRLCFTHPVTSEVIDLRSDLPPDMANLLEQLRQETKK